MDPAQRAFARLVAAPCAAAPTPAPPRAAMPTLPPPRAAVARLSGAAAGRPARAPRLAVGLHCFPPRPVLVPPPPTAPPRRNLRPPPPRPSSPPNVAAAAVGRSFAGALSGRAGARGARAAAPRALRRATRRERPGHRLRRATDTLRVMRLLILGGTVFLGRHVAAEALARGHEVTVFHRGRHGADLFAGDAEHLIGDRGARPARARGRAPGTRRSTRPATTRRRRGVVRAARRRRRRAPRVRLDLQRLPDVAGRAGERGRRRSGPRATTTGPDKAACEREAEAALPGPRRPAPRRPALRPARQRLPPAVVGPRIGARAATCSRPASPTARCSSSTLATSRGWIVDLRRARTARDLQRHRAAPDDDARPARSAVDATGVGRAADRGPRRGARTPRGLEPWARCRSGSRRRHGSRDVDRSTRRAPRPRACAAVRLAETVADVWAWLQASGGPRGRTGTGELARRPAPPATGMDGLSAS